jgi:hypothetical protein
MALHGGSSFFGRPLVLFNKKAFVRECLSLRIPLSTLELSE